MRKEPRADKVAVVAEMKDRLSGADAVIVTEYRGLTVDAMSTLRRELRPAGGRYRVCKNTLARRAAVQAGLAIEELLVGPTALAFVEKTPDGGAGDVVTVAKVLRDFAKANPDLIVKGGVFDGEIVDAEALDKLADVEPREVLLAKLAGLMAAPMQQLAGMLQALPRDFAFGLKALIEQGGAPGAPTAEAGDGAADSVEEADAEAPAEAPNTPADEADQPEENESPDAGEGEES